MLTRLRLGLLRVRLWLDTLTHLRYERYRKRYHELMRKPMTEFTDKDYRDFERIYEFFHGDITHI